MKQIIMESTIMTLGEPIEDLICIINQIMIEYGTKMTELILKPEYIKFSTIEVSK